LKSSQEMKEKEEHSYQMLTQWEIELNMMEDWLGNPGTKEDCPRDAIVNNEENLQPKKKMDEVGIVLAQEEC
jgi:hypothetical protein